MGTFEDAWKACNATSEKLEDVLPAGWIVANSPTMISGAVEWVGKYRNGSYYAAGPLKQYASEWKKLGAKKVCQGLSRSTLCFIKEQSSVSMDFQKELSRLNGEASDWRLDFISGGMSVGEMSESMGQLLSSAGISAGISAGTSGGTSHEDSSFSLGR